MTKDELLDAINFHRVVEFDGIKGIPIGYQVIVNEKGRKEYSAGIKEYKGKNTLHWVHMWKVKLADKVKG